MDPHPAPVLVVLIIPSRDHHWQLIVVHRCDGRCRGASSHVARRGQLQQDPRVVVLYYHVHLFGSGPVYQRGAVATATRPPPRPRPSPHPRPPPVAGTRCQYHLRGRRQRPPQRRVDDHGHGRRSREEGVLQRQLGDIIARRGQEAAAVIHHGQERAAAGANGIGRAAHGRGRHWQRHLSQNSGREYSAGGEGGGGRKNS